LEPPVTDIVYPFLRYLVLKGWLAGGIKTENLFDPG